MADVDVAAGAMLENKIVATAKDHGDRYLLLRRYRPPRDLAPTQIDLEYEACQRLVDRREARWLNQDPGPGPGIELILPPGKGWALTKKVVDLYD